MDDKFCQRHYLYIVETTVQRCHYFHYSTQMLIHPKKTHQDKSYSVTGVIAVLHLIIESLSNLYLLEIVLLIESEE